MYPSTCFANLYYNNWFGKKLNKSNHWYNRGSVVSEFHVICHVLSKILFKLNQRIKRIFNCRWYLSCVLFIRTESKDSNKSNHWYNRVLWYLNSMSSAMFFARFCSNWIRELKEYSIVADISLVCYSFEQNCMSFIQRFE